MSGSVSASARNTATRTAIPSRPNSSWELRSTAVRSCSSSTARRRSSTISLFRMRLSKAVALVSTVPPIHDGSIVRSYGRLLYSYVSTAVLTPSSSAETRLYVTAAVRSIRHGSPSRLPRRIWSTPATAAPSSDQTRSADHPGGRTVQYLPPGDHESDLSCVKGIQCWIQVSRRTYIESRFFQQA